MVELISVLAIATYSLRALLFLIGSTIERRRNPKSNTIIPFISIVIPARNEEENIATCLNSVLAVNYPRDRFEVVVVDDDSSDNTNSICVEFADRNSQVRVIKSHQQLSKSNLVGKPNALHCGIEASVGEIVAMTDADCTVNTEWLQEIAKAFSEKNVGMVAGFTMTESKKIFHKLQATEWIIRHSFAQGGLGMKQNLGCFGNNLSIRRDVYFAIGGYTNIPFSVTEDLMLILTVDRAGYDIRYICTDKSYVTTKAAATVREYFKQQHRWSKGGLRLGWKALVFVFSSAIMWLALILSAATGAWALFSTIFLARIFWDYAVITPSLAAMRQLRLLPWVLPDVLMFLLVELVVPFLSFSGTVTWKGRTYNVTGK